MLCSGHCPRGSLQRSHQRPEASEGGEGFSLKMDEARGCRHCPLHRTPPIRGAPLGSQKHQLRARGHWGSGRRGATALLTPASSGARAGAAPAVASASCSVSRSPGSEPTPAANLEVQIKSRPRVFPCGRAHGAEKREDAASSAPAILFPQNRPLRCWWYFSPPLALSI